MSPAGFSNDDENQPRTKDLVLRPQVKKTLIKGVIPLVILTPFLSIAQNLANYFIFVALWFGAVGLYMAVKHGSKFLIGDENIVVKRVLGKSRSISYRDIVDLSVSEGILARRFGCGSIYLILKEGKGGVNIMGGGTAERLEDILEPNYIYDLISSKLGPYPG
jgi:hypothetical protein